MNVPIFPKPGAGTHPYLRRIFTRHPKDLRRGETGTEEEFERLTHEWKIDNESPAIRITNKQAVTVLVYSTEVGKKAGAEGSDAVAITFAVGARGPEAKDPVATGKPIEQDRAKMSGGRVLHVMSHFGKQKSVSDEYTIQNLLLNFLIEASERRGFQKEAAQKKK
ncbi:MAG: hypothetical protein HY716_12145 [Planctomycetes bacterium]|nr:hypothetical protein [Planctomycetota bacterium]